MSQDASLYKLIPSKLTLVIKLNLLNSLGHELLVTPHFIVFIPSIMFERKFKVENWERAHWWDSNSKGKLTEKCNYAFGKCLRNLFGCFGRPKTKKKQWKKSKHLRRRTPEPFTGGKPRFWRFKFNICTFWKSFPAFSFNHSGLIRFESLRLLILFAQLLISSYDLLSILPVRIFRVVALFCASFVFAGHGWIGLLFDCCYKRHLKNATFVFYSGDTCWILTGSVCRVSQRVLSSDEDWIFIIAVSATDASIYFMAFTFFLMDIVIDWLSILEFGTPFSMPSRIGF